MRLPRWPRRLPAGTASPPTAEAATEQDILACFRLLLGRQPNPEELRGHMMRVGEDLPGVVTSYLRSLEFARRGLLDRNVVAGLAISEVEGLQIYTSLDDAAVGKYVRAGVYEHDVTTVFRQYVRAGMHVVDIGANIGYFSLLSAALVGERGHVTAVEPNPRNVRLLEASRRANAIAGMTILQMAAGREIGLLALNASYSNGITSDLSEGAAAALQADLVACLPLDLVLASAPPVDVIKVDVEGAEYNALLGCRAAIARHRPIIISEFSPVLMQGISGINGAGYVQWLAAAGYAISVIEPDGSLTAVGADAALVLQHHAERGIDHIDIVALPA